MQMLRRIHTMLGPGKIDLVTKYIFRHLVVPIYIGIYPLLNRGVGTLYICNPPDLRPKSRGLHKKRSGGQKRQMESIPRKKGSRLQKSGPEP